MGDTMRERREQLRLTRAEVAQACGLSLNYYYELEMGIKKNPTLEVVEKVAKCLQTTPGTVADMIVSGPYLKDRSGAPLHESADLYLNTLGKGIRSGALKIDALSDGVWTDDAVGYCDDQYYYLYARRAYQGVSIMLLGEGGVFPETCRNICRILLECGIVEADLCAPLRATRKVKAKNGTVRLLQIRRTWIDGAQKDRLAAAGEINNRL